MYFLIRPSSKEKSSYKRHQLKQQGQVEQRDSVRKLEYIIHDI